MHLENNELEWLAGHLGHDVNVHKEYYRLKDSAIELAKVSRLLIAIDSGNGKDLAEKSLSDIQLNGNASSICLTKLLICMYFCYYLILVCSVSRCFYN